MKNLLACYANCRYNTRCDDLRNEVLNKPEQAASDINRYLAERGRKPILIQFPKRGVKFVEVLKPETLKQEKRAEKRPDAAPGDLKAQAGKEQKKVEAVKVKPVAALIAGEGSNAPITRPSKSRRAEQSRPQPVKKAVKRHSIRKASLRTEARADIKLRTRVAMARKTKRAERAPEKEHSSIASPPEQEASMNKPQPKKRAARRRAGGSKNASTSQKSGKQYIILVDNSATLVDELGLMRYLLDGPAPSARYFEASEVEARVQIIHKR
jgi:hypothetical protein